MDPFSSAHQTDEGYSEDPLNPSSLPGLSMPESGFSSHPEFPSWLAGNLSSLPASVKKELTMSLLDQLPTSSIAEIMHRLNPRLYIDFVHYLPAEICLKILGYLDPVSLAGVMRTCRTWCNLALNRKPWKRLYHLEGWKVFPNEIELCETQVNARINTSIRKPYRFDRFEPGSLSQSYSSLSSTEDLDMTDSDRAYPSYNNSPTSTVKKTTLLPPYFQTAQTATARSSSHDAASFGKGKGPDSVPDQLINGVRGKRKQPGGSPILSSSPSAYFDVPNASLKSTLWSWDTIGCRYRISWKYLYNMRRRLESNWELGKNCTFQLPHPCHPEEGHSECVYTLQFDANYLVSGSRDQTMRIWDMRTLRLVRPPLVGHDGSVLCLQFDADPAEDILVSGSSDSHVFIWRFSTGELVQRVTTAHRESVLNVRFDRRILVTSSKDKTIKIFNRRPLRNGDLGYDTAEMGVNPLPTTVKRYGIEADLAYDLPPKEPFTMIGRLEGHGAAVNAIQVRGRTIVSVSGDRQIKVWDWPDQVCIQTIPAHDKGIACVEFDGRRIVSGSSDYEVCIFDAPTGLKVAQLRGHDHLVRTVQVGFGDLPHSRDSDLAEAKAIDADYFRAVEAGEIPHGSKQYNRRGRRVNAGSSRPSEIQAFGAKLPPGGGGGKKYGRIVSGSYDQSIIVWRRDKEGVWKPAHHLRQEEAAFAAQRHMTKSSVASSTAASAGARPSVSSSLLRGSDAFTPRQADGGDAESHPAGRSSLLPAMADFYDSIISQAVPLGLGALEEAMRTHPAILVTHLHQLQLAIEREPSSTRSLLRQAVARTVLATRRTDNKLGDPTQSATPYGPGALTGGTSATAAAAHTGASVVAAAVAGFNPFTAPTTNAPPHGATQAVPRAQALPSAPNLQNAQLGLTRPHAAGVEAAPARVFKLQFDARKIVCCSQSPLIVGWDFCNGDPELEEVARFFAAID